MKNKPFTGRPGEEPENDLSSFLLVVIWVRRLGILCAVAMLAQCAQGATMRIVNATNVPLEVIRTGAVPPDRQLGVAAGGVLDVEFANGAWGSNWTARVLTEYSSITVETLDTTGSWAGDDWQFTWYIVQETDGTGGLRPVNSVDNVRGYTERDAADSVVSSEGALEIVWKGFCFGMALELFGLILRVVRAARSRTGEVP